MYYSLPTSKRLSLSSVTVHHTSNELQKGFKNGIYLYVYRGSGDRTFYNPRPSVLNITMWYLMWNKIKLKWSSFYCSHIWCFLAVMKYICELLPLFPYDYTKLLHLDCSVVNKPLVYPAISVTLHCISIKI